MRPKGLKALMQDDNRPRGLSAFRGGGVSPAMVAAIFALAIAAVATVYSFDQRAALLENEDGTAPGDAASAGEASNDTPAVHEEEPELQEIRSRTPVQSHAPAATVR